MQKYLFLVLLTVSLMACHRPHTRVTGVTTEAIEVNALADDVADKGYTSQLAPVKADLEREMSVQLGYAPERLWVGSPECPMLNWATEALLDEARRIYEGQVDMAVVNMGGMRCEWPAGPVTRGNVFELMPFDNRLVVLTLKGSDVMELCQSFATYGGQGVAGLRMKAIGGKVKEITIGGKPLKANALYKVATSDYLSGGTDHMEALTKYVEYHTTDSIIRDLYIHAVRQQDTIRAIVDGRMNIQ